MALIANKVQENLISKGLGGSITSPEENNPCEEIEINLEAIINTEENFYPLTGEYAGTQGWVWNKTLPQNFDSRYGRIENSVGGYEYNLEEGSIEKDWQGAVLAGMRLKEIKIKLEGASRESWVPEIEKGSYSILNFENSLLSKSQICKVLKSNEITLEEETLENSVKVTLFKRDNLYNNLPFFKYVNTSLGLEDLSFSVDENLVSVNQLKTIFIGSERTDKYSVECHYENKGFGNEGREIVYSTYFPITDVKVITIDSEEVIKEWTKVDSFKNKSSTFKVFKVDEESGKIIFPKKITEKSFYLKEDLGKELVFFEPLEEIKEEGKLKLGATEYSYRSKSKYKVTLSETERVASLEEGVAFQAVQEGAHLNESTVYISYLAVPRVDYEVQENSFTNNINLKPYSTINSNGILQLSVDEKNIKKIILSSDKPKILGNIFGEVFIGTDSSRLTAEVINGNGRAVEEIPVEFYVSEGRFGNGAKKSIDSTNLEGKSFAFYAHDYEEESVGLIVNPRQINSESYFEIDNLSPGLTAEDIVLFQVLKTDPVKGSLGYKVDIRSFELNDKSIKVTIVDDYILNSEEYKSMYEPNYTIGNVVNESLPLSIKYNYGLAILYFDNGRVSARTTIKNIEENTIQLDTGNLSGEYYLYGEPSAIRIFKRGELEFSLEEAVATNKSFDRLIYSYDFDEEIYRKLKPTHIEGNRIYYDKVLPSGSRDENNILAGYKIFYPKLVDVYAEAINPATGQRLRSNLIKLKVSLPSYLSSSNGFKFLENNDEEGSGLGGTNFLSINPEVNNKLNVLLF